MSSSVRNLVPALLGLILISPLFELPRPINVSSIPWRVEFLFSAFLVIALVAAFRSESFRAGLRNAAAHRPVRIIVGLMAAFCVWSALSSKWAASPTAAIHHTLLWANYVVVFVAAFATASSLKGKGKILLALGTPAALIAALAAIDFLTIQDFATQEGTLRIRYGKFAEMLAVIAPVLFSAAVILRNRRKFGLALASGSAAWIGVMLSLSKGAFLAGAAGFILLFFFLVIFKRELFQKTLTAGAVWILLTVTFQLGASYFTDVPSTVNYISGSADATRSTSDMRVYTWKAAGEMIRSNAGLGVGADNFGLSFNESRATLAQSRPQDPDSAIGEYYVFERAHNEPLQIFAELGVVGIVLFSALVLASFFFIASMAYRDGRRLSPLFFGGAAGMAAFVGSSLVSSFSFRAYQNGLVFFFIFGLTFAVGCGRSSSSKLEWATTGTLFRPLAFAAAVLLLVFSTSKAASQFMLYYGERSRELATATKYFEIAAQLDPDNPGAELASAEAFARENRWADAVPHFRLAVDRGFGVSVVYSYLANAQEKSGDLESAEETLKESARIFPRSTFVRARLAVVQEQLGKFAEAGEQLAVARSIDERQLNGWYSVLKDGILNAHLKATSDPTRFAAPPDLLPTNAIYAYNTDKVRVD